MPSGGEETTASISGATIKGTIKVNALLSVDTVSTGNVGTLTYQWYRTTTNGAINTASDTAISTNSTYQLASSDKDNYIYYIVSGTGSLRKESNIVGPIENADVPSEKVSDLNFTDADRGTNEIGGTLGWSEPANHSNITCYNIYTSADGSTKGTLITTAAINTSQIAIPQNTSYSSFILAVCSNATGESATCTSIAVTDAFNLNQAAPMGLAGTAPTSALNDGKITGVTTAMEYKISSGGAVYIAVTGTEVTGLTAETYLVRYSAKEGYNAGTPAAVEVPEYVASDQYGLVKAFEQTTGILDARVRLLNANGLTITYDISSHLDVELTKGQLVAYGLNEPGEIGAVIPTNSAISVAPGLKILSADELTINDASYDILDNAVIFTYDGVTPGATICNYDIAAMVDVVFNVSAVSPASIYLNDESKVAALLIPISLLEGPVIPTAIIQQPSALTITEGGIASFAVVATGSSLSFQWQLSTDGGSHFDNISNGGGYNGERSTTLVINPATYLMNNYIYRVQVSGSSGSAVSSNASLIVTVNAPTVGANPSPVAVMEGGSVSFSSWSNGWLTSHKWQVSSNGGITFDNIENGGIYSGAGSPTLTISPVSLAMNGYLYRLVFYGPGGSAITSSAALTVNAAPSAPLITGNPSPTSIYEDGNASFTVTAAGLNLTYQWQTSTNGGISFTNLTAGSPYSGVNSKTLTISPAALSFNGYQYLAVVNGTGGTAISSSAGLTVNPLLFITSQPVSVTVSEGGIANFSVSATGIGLGYLYYQWQVSNDNGYSYANIPSMSGYGVYGMGVGPVSGIIHDGLMYRVVITAGGKTVTSNGAELTVGSPPVAPTISTPPVSTTSVALGSASFSATGSSWQGSLDYQWQLSTDGGSLFNNITNGGIYSGAATPALSINPVSLSMSGYQYRVIIHCSNGLSTTSSAVTLTVVSPVAITVNPVSVTVTAGGIASFSVTASGTNLNYNWEVSNNGGTSYNDIFDITGLSGEHASTLVVSPAAMSMNGYRFRVEVSGFGGTVISSPASLAVIALPDVQLTGLTENLSNHFSPSFAGNVYSYNINAAASESTINLTPTLDGAVITWNVDTDSAGAQYVTSGSIAAIPLEMGVNIITVHVEKAGTTSKDYEITVSRLSNKLTIMVYGDGDNNLESYLLDDIAEMKNGVTDDVNLIILVDRAAGHTGRTDVLDGNFEDTRLYRISNGTATRISGESHFPGITANTSTELNMGDASTLCNFIDFCKEYYSADKYMLVLWNHGGGARSLAGAEQEIDEEKSICEDESSGDYLYTAEISDELSSAQSVDILGFDACLMGSIEVAYQYGPGGSGFSADTMVASAPNVWGFGWDYEEILKRLNSGLAGQESGGTDITLGGNELYYDPETLTNATLGAIIVEEQRDSTPEDSGQSLAFYDLSLIDEVKSEVDAFAASLSSVYSTTLAALTIETIRDNALAFFDTTNEDEMITTPFYDLYDLVDGISSGSADPTVVSHANLVKGIVDQFVLYSFAKFDGFNEGSNGVSIFFPDGDATYIQPDDGESYPHWAYQWWYNPIDTQEFIGPNFKYGKLKWCMDDLTQTTEAVSNWFELLDYWYDDLYNTDWNFYSFVDPTIVDDNSTSGAISLTIDVVQSNQAIYPTGDVDWFKFDAVANTSYAVDVYNRFGGIITEISFYDEHGTALMEDVGAFWYDCGPDDAGTYYIKVVNVFTDPPYSIGRYDIIVTQQ
ncbi:MAG TPA: clostripain, partial [Anaerovoracaceae bacterium]|nr:clostripain [Anaerovoracaceae bacterium]